MTEMLTAKEMESLLHVDRSTIYRMADSGRLPAIKVGKQWRFPAEKVEEWLRVDITNYSPQPSTMPDDLPVTQDRTLREILPLDCVQLIQDTFADLLGVMLVITDMEGRPITRASHTCGLFDVINNEPDALERCMQSWHSLASTIDLEPRFSRSHLGLLCTRALVRVGMELKGMVVAGCVAPDIWPPASDEIRAIADEFGVPETRIQNHLLEVFNLDREERQRVLGTVQRIANIVAHIVNERRLLMGRLSAIADLTTF